MYISAHIISSEKGKRGNELDIDVVGKLELSSLNSALLELLLVQTNSYMSVLFLTKSVNIPNDQVVNRSRRLPDPEFKDGLDGNWLTHHHQEESSPTEIQRNTKETHRNIKETHRNTKETHINTKMDWTEIGSLIAKRI